MGRGSLPAVGFFARRTPCFVHSRLVDRSHVKPRDYAGAYPTLQMVPSIDHRGEGRLIPDLSAEAARGRLAAAAQQ